MGQILSIINLYVVIVEAYGVSMGGGCMRHKKKMDKSVYRSFAMITQFGINMLVPIGLMTWLGVYLDKRFGTSYLMVVLFFVGAVAGGRNVYRMAQKVYGTKSSKEDVKENPKDNDREVEKGE